MKRILTILYSLAALLASSCTNDIDSLNIGGYGDVVNFSVSSDIVMRSVATQDEFVAGNTVGIYMNGGDGAMLSDNVKYTVNSSGGLDYTSGEKILYPTSGETATFYAFSPYPTVASRAIAIDILSDENELLVSNKPTGSQTSTDAITLTFTHTLSKVKISYTPTNEIPKLDKVYIVGSTKASCKIADNALTVVESSKSTIAATIAENADGVTQDVEAIILPTNEGNAIEIYYNYTIGGDKYAKKSTLSTTDFASGYIYSFDLALGDDYATLSAGGIEQWGSEDLGADTSTKYIGDGSEANPWGIYTEADMKLIGTDGKRLLSHYYILMNNIELQEAWTPIGDSSTQFTGTFDGGGYEISGLSVSGDIQYAGLFGYNNGGTISKLGVAGSVSSSYNENSERVGGVVGYNKGGTITDCYNSCAVNGTYYVGGIVGSNGSGATVVNCYNLGVIGATTTSATRVGGVVAYNAGTIINCYNSGKITGSATYIGGVVGSNINTITNCYNSGKITGSFTNAGGVVGYNIDTITNCYWNTTNYTGKGIGSDDTQSQTTTGMTDDEMKDASFVITLNNNASKLTGACAWVATETYPTFDFDGTPTYTETDIEYKSEDGGDNYAYYIYTVKGLHAFRDLVNGSGNSTSAGIKGFESSAFDSANGSINGVLTKSIDLNSEAWTPIGDGTNTFEGSFDGGGYEISGLSVSGAIRYAGLFGYNNINGKISNLGVAGSVSSSYDDSNERVGGVVGYNRGTITDCYNSCTVNGTRYIGGVVGSNGSGATVVNCYNLSVINVVTTASNTRIGGVVGYNGGDIINCYNSVAVSGTAEAIGGVVGSNHDDIINCYNSGAVSGTATNLGSVAGYNNGTITNCYNSGALSGSATYAGGVAGYNYSNSTITNCYSSGTFTGTASTAAGGVVGYNIGTINVCYWNTINYTGNGIGKDANSQTTTGMTDTQMKDSVFLTILNDNASELTSSDACAWEVDSVSGYPTLDFDGTPTDSGTYYISNADELGAFRDKVNAGSTSIKGVLMANINLESEAWTPIGDGTNKFSGTFEGWGYEISGLSVSGYIVYKGLFGYNRGTISKLGVSGSVSSDSSYYCSANSYLGGVVGYNDNNGIIINCYNSAMVDNGNSSGSRYVGGVAAYNIGIIINCYNSAEVNDSVSTISCSTTIGGVVAYNSGTITNCYNSSAKVNFSYNGDGDDDNYIGSVVGYNSGTINDCYWNRTNYTGNGIGGGNNANGVTDMKDTEMKGTSFVGTLNDNVKTYYETYPTICSWTQEVEGDSYPTLDFGSTQND